MYLSLLLVIATVNTSVINSLSAVPVEVEAEVKPVKNAKDRRFEIIGLADTAVREARQRVVSVIDKLGVKLDAEVLVNLAPAEIRKDGSSLDLPILLSLLLAVGKIDAAALDLSACYGELALDGSIKQVRGILAHALTAKEQGRETIFVPANNFQEASLVQDLEVVPVETVIDLMRHLSGEESVAVQPVAKVTNSNLPQLTEVSGQSQAKRALTIAAAGGHNVLFVGPPGCGKSMLAKRYLSILPPLSQRDLIATAQLYSLAGEDPRSLFSGLRPYRAPHHVISQVGLIGGGNSPRPGEISLAHNGVLFLDELPEFGRHVLDALRAPLENKKVLISRSKYNIEIPANFQLIAAMNPCPCGKLGVKGVDCLCSANEIKKYLQKISQPILDRIDLQVGLQAIDLRMLKKHTSRASDINYLELVQKGRDFATQHKRADSSTLSNQAILDAVSLDADAERFIDDCVVNRHLSARSYFRSLKVARTIADLEESPAVKAEHLAEALSFRSLDLIREYAS